MIIYNNKKTKINENYFCNNYEFLKLEICYLLKSSEFILKYKNINIDLHKALRLIKENNNVIVIRKCKPTVLDKIQTTEYLGKYNIYEYILNKKILDIDIYEEDLKKEIIIKTNMETYKLYDFYNIGMDIRIPIIIKKDSCLKKSIQYKVFIDKIHLSLNYDEKFLEETDDFIKFKLKINDYLNYLDVSIYYNKYYIMFYYKKEYNMEYETIVSKICNIVNVNEYIIIKRNIDRLFVISDDIDIKILYYIIKINKILNNIFIINEVNKLSILKGVIYLTLDFYNIKVNIIIKSIKNKLEILVTDIKDENILHIIKHILNILLSIYKEYNKEIFLLVLGKIRKINNENKSLIKSLRVINPSLFVSGYTKHASVNFNYI